MDSKKMVDYSEKYIKWFSDIKITDSSFLGLKPAILGELFRKNFPIPSGFVLTPSSFNDFIKSNNLHQTISDILSNTDFNNPEAIHNSSVKIQKIILSMELQKDLVEEVLDAYHLLSSENLEDTHVSEDALNILRTAQEPCFISISSTFSSKINEKNTYAGLLPNFLNIKGDQKLIKHILKTFAEIYSAKSLYYHYKKNIPITSQKISIIIQKMIDSEQSGKIFSQNPLSFNEEMIIESVYGLGISLISGKITPDQYVLTKDLKIKESVVSEKKIAIVRSASGDTEIIKLNPERSISQVLTLSQIMELGNYVKKINQILNSPVSVEFAIEEGKIYILGSELLSPISKKENSSSFSGNLLFKGKSGSSGITKGYVKMISSFSDLFRVKNKDIIFLETLSPEILLCIDKISGIITNYGGLTSDGAILSREFNIPLIIDGGVQKINENTFITMNGDSGEVYEGEVKQKTSSEINPILDTNRIKLKLLLDFPEDIDISLKTNIYSVGLLDLEEIIVKSGRHWLDYEQKGDLDTLKQKISENLNKIIKHFDSVWIKTADSRTDLHSSLKGSPEREPNPLLGSHGVRFNLKHPKILLAQLESIKDLSLKYPDKEFGLMFSFVSSINEIKQVQEYFNNFKTSNMKLGIILETPGSVQIIDDICNSGIDFITINTDTLVELTLGIDKENKETEDFFEELPSSIFSQLKRIIGSCRRNKIPTNIYGECTTKPEMVEYLYRKGINFISLFPDKAYDVSLIIKQLEDEWERSNHKTENFIKNSRPTSQNNQSTTDKKLPQIKENISVNLKDYKEEIKDLNKPFNLPETPNRQKVFESVPSQIEPFNNTNRIEELSDKITNEIKKENLKEEETKNNVEVTEDIGILDGNIHEKIGVYNPDQKDDNSYPIEKYNFDEEEDEVKHLF